MIKALVKAIVQQPVILLLLALSLRAFRVVNCTETFTGDQYFEFSVSLLSLPGEVIETFNFDPGERTGVVPTDCKVIIEEATPFGIQCHDERYDFDLIVQEILSKSSVREYNFSITAEDQTSMVTVRIRPPSISLAITSEINVNLIEVGQVLPTNPICMDANDDVTTLPNGRNNGKFVFYPYDFDISAKSTQIYSYFSIRNDSLIEIVRHPLELYTNNITNFVLNIVCTDFGSPQSLRTLARINISLFGGECGLPEVKPNAGVSLPGGTDFFAVGIYECNDGYILSGDPSIYCQTSKTWTISNATCTVCEPLPNVTNGYVTYPQGSKVGTAAEYICHFGFKITGNPFRFCNGNGNWGGIAPSCTLVDCNQPKDGFRNHVLTPNGTTFNAVAEYICDEGYIIYGNDKRTCLSSGEWSGSVIHCAVTDCGVPEDIPNGSVLTPDGTTHGSQGYFNCSKGFNLHNGHLNIICLGGKWSGSLPSCSRIDCGEPKGVRFGVIDTHKGLLYPSLGMYSCFEGHQLMDGNQVIMCTDNGEWFGEVPFCQALPAVTQPKSESNFPAIIGGSVAAAIILGFLIGCILCFIFTCCFCYPCCMNKSEDNTTYADEIEKEDIIEVTHVERREKNGIAIRDFPTHVARLHSENNIYFIEEYEKLKDYSPNMGVAFAQFPENIRKNRYANILPYDDSRVTLNPLDLNPANSYINASYIDGYMKTKEYIATQGPTSLTCDDFWRMVWEQNSSLIIRLTNLEEKGRIKCEKYWPDNSEMYGTIEVELSNSTVVEEGLIINTFQVRKGSECRKVEHLSFLNWPDHGVPENVQPFLNLVQWFDKLYNPQEDGRPIIHCSAGVGRTGTLICVRSMIQMIEDKGEVDIFNFVVEMRRKRMFMVQTKWQYIFIHDAVLEYLSNLQQSEDDKEAL